MRGHCYEDFCVETRYQTERNNKGKQEIDTKEVELLISLRSAQTISVVSFMPDNLNLIVKDSGYLDHTKA